MNSTIGSEDLFIISRGVLGLLKWVCIAVPGVDVELVLRIFLCNVWCAVLVMAGGGVVFVDGCVSWYGGSYGVGFARGTRVGSV